MNASYETPTSSDEFPLDRRLYASLDLFLAQRPPGADEDVHMLTAMVDHVIRRCTGVGDVVLDPFAGFGTVMERAVVLAREAVGVELLSDRVAYVRKRVPSARVFEGDARALFDTVQQAVPQLVVGGVDLVLTSPPYMTASDHPADPLSGYELNDGDYHRYLRELENIAAQCARLVAPGGWVVWNVADIHDRGQTTWLIADCARVLAKYFTLVGITEIVWDQYPHDLIGDALLVFQNSVDPGSAVSE